MTVLCGGAMMTLTPKARYLGVVDIARNSATIIWPKSISGSRERYLRPHLAGGKPG